MNYLIEFLKVRKGKLFLITLMLLGQVVGTLLIPFLIADMIDIGIMNQDMDAVIKIAIQMLCVAVIAAGISVYGSYLCADFGAMFGRDMREALFRRTQILSKTDLDIIGTSSLITRTTSDITNIQQTLVMVLQMIIPAPMIAIVTIIMSAYINLEITMILVITMMIFVLIAYLVMKKSQILSSQIQVKMDKINQIVRESIVGIRVIRAFDNSRFEKKRSDDVFEEYATNMISLNRVFAVLNPTVWFFMGLTMAAIVGFGGLRSAQGAMAIGQITSLSEYAILSLGYLIMASFACVTLPKMLSCLKRLKEVLDMNPKVKDPINPTKLKSAAHSLEFNDVTFSYHGAQLPVLHHLSFQCVPNQTTAIIGSTGSGKSTIATILQRLHDIDSGKILINGVSIEDISQHDLRETIAYVPQKAYLFSGTIEENLKMGKKDATKQEMDKAIEIAQAKSFIDSLQDGLSSKVSQGGTNFSGGQKQRLAIARALIKEANILVFDDSFSALDFKTDAALRNSLKMEVKDTITIVIAQRISTIIDADQIIVLDNGNIVGIGKHEELMNNCRVYQEIAYSQNPQEEVSK